MNVAVSQARPKSFKLAALGAVLGVGVSSAVLMLLPRSHAPAVHLDSSALAGTVLVEDEGALDEIVVHFTASQAFIVEDTYSDFLRALDPTTRIVAVVAANPDAGPGDADLLRALLARIDPSGALLARTRIVATPGPFTVWSKDRALVLAAPPRQRIQLVVPVRPDPRWRERWNDWATLASIAQAFPDEFLVSEVPLDFDAGDFAVTGDTVIVDDNLLVKNQKRGLVTREALTELLGRTFHRKIVFLGAKDGDVPRHHLSMYMTPIGGGAVLVGDPAAGRAFVGERWAPGEESPDTGDALMADFSPENVARFERAASDLRASGFRVERIPVVPFDDKTYLTYTNGVYESRGGHKIAYLPQYARAPLGAEAPDPIARMDEIAAQTYRRLGWEVRPIRVRETYRFHGTIGCLCNVLRRREHP